MKLYIAPHASNSPMVLHLVVRPPGQKLGDLRPAVSELCPGLGHNALLVRRPGVLLDRRVCEKQLRSACVSLVDASFLMGWSAVHGRWVATWKHRAE